MMKPEVLVVLHDMTKPPERIKGKEDVALSRPTKAGTRFARMWFGRFYGWTGSCRLAKRPLLRSGCRLGLVLLLPLIAFRSLLELEPPTCSLVCVLLGRLPHARERLLPPGLAIGERRPR